MAILVLLLLFPLIYGVWKASYEVYITSRIDDPYFSGYFRGSEAKVMQFVDADSPLSVRTLGALALRGVCSPSPLRFFQNLDYPTAIEAMIMLTWYFIFPLAIIGGWVHRHDPVIFAALGCIVLVVFAAAGGISVGTDPFRHRIAVFPMIVLLAVPAMNWNVLHRYRWIFMLWGMLVTVFSAGWAYISLM